MAFRALAVVAALMLSACSAGGLTTSPSPRALAPLRDDIAGMLVVFDLPRGLGAPAKLSSLTFAAPGMGPVKALLVEADADTIAANLPPPAAGHAYYFFGLSPADQGALRAAQAVARAAHARDADVSLAIVPRLCRAADADVSKAQVSVLAALPGPAPLVPLIDRRPLADVTANAPLPAC
jgi:hypothetical protein